MSKNNTPYIEEFKKYLMHDWIFHPNMETLDKELTKTIESEREKAVEDFITKMYGKRCKEMGIGCVVCAMWELYDEYIK